MTNIYSMAIHTIFLIHPSKNKQIWCLVVDLVSLWYLETSWWLPMHDTRAAMGSPNGNFPPSKVWNHRLDLQRFCGFCIEGQGLKTWWQMVAESSQYCRAWWLGIKNIPTHDHNIWSYLVISCNFRRSSMKTCMMLDGQRVWNLNLVLCVLWRETWNASDFSWWFW